MKRDVLDGRTSSTNRASACNRTIKISASIATTFWIRTAEQRFRYGTPVPPKNCDRERNICAVGLLQFSTPLETAAVALPTSERYSARCWALMTNRSACLDAFTRRQGQARAQDFTPSF
jgi:hypothetical protein